MKHTMFIALLTLCVTLFYDYVGHLVPQKESHPPKEVKIGEGASTADMVKLGQELFDGKGTCKSCHNGNARFPDFEKEKIGQIAGSRRPGMSDVEYLAEAIYEPNAYIVPPFAGGMVIPSTLTDQEILCLIAYLQSFGGTPNVTMTTKLKWQGSRGDAGTPTAGAAAAPAQDRTGEQIFTEGQCMACHSTTAPVRLVGPSLYDVGKRLTIPELFEAILDPDKTIAKGDPPYAPMMGGMLGGGGFYKKNSANDIKKLVEYLATLKGETKG